MKGTMFMNQIRLAQVSDASELKRLNDLHNGEDCNSLESIEESLKDNPHELVCVAAGDDRLYGFCCGQICKSMCYPFFHAEITDLYVSDECRRQGVGKKLVEFMENELTERGVRHFHILTFKDNASAQALYCSCGFSVIPEMLLEKNV